MRKLFTSLALLAIVATACSNKSTVADDETPTDGDITEFCAINAELNAMNTTFQAGAENPEPADAAVERLIEMEEDQSFVPEELTDEASLTLEAYVEFATDLQAVDYDPSQITAEDYFTEDVSDAGQTIQTFATENC